MLYALYIFQLQKFLLEQAIDAYVVILAEARNGLTQRALILKASFFVGTPAANIFIHILSLNTIQVQFHKAVAHHQSGRFSAITLAPGCAVPDNDVELGALVDVVDIFQSDEADQAIITF